MNTQAWQEIAAQKAWEKAQRILIEDSRQRELSDYALDPVAFGEEVLKEHYTEDVQEVMESVRDNPITIARSANAVGKSHGAARIAAWFLPNSRPTPGEPETNPVGGSNEYRATP
jgi:hypothetical protein